MPKLRHVAWRIFLYQCSDFRTTSHCNRRVMYYVSQIWRWIYLACFFSMWLDLRNFIGLSVTSALWQLVISALWQVYVWIVEIPTAPSLWKATDGLCYDFDCIIICEGKITATSLLLFIVPWCVIFFIKGNKQHTIIGYVYVTWGNPVAKTNNEIIFSGGDGGGSK